MIRLRSMVTLRQRTRRRQTSCLLLTILCLGQIVAQNTSAQQQPPQQQSGTATRQSGETLPASAQGRRRPGDQARAGSETRRTAAGSITGRVLAEGGQPPLSATVFATAVGAAVPPQRTGTDADGKFRLDGLAPAAYHVWVHAPGYIVPPEVTVGLREAKYYRPGDTVNISLAKGGVITGTVTNSNGEPVIAIPVRVFRVRYHDGRPARDSVQSSNTRWTDDRGIYRIYGLEPGSYIVMAGGRDPFYGGRLYENELRTYYPSATRDTATEVTVNSGQEVSSVDIRYRGEPGHTVSGTVSGGFSTEPNHSSVNVILAHVTSGAFEAATYISSWENARVFSLSGVSDGDYYIFARRGSVESAASSIPRRITVKGADVTGLELSLVPLGSIAGRLVLETARDTERQAECQNRRSAWLEEVILKARRDETAADKEKLPWAFSQAGESAPDNQGNFELRLLAAGRYRFLASMPDDSWYVRSITMPAATQSNQPVDVMRDGLALKPGERARGLTITLALGAARLHGRVAATVEGARPQQQSAHQRVHLVPAEREHAESVLRFAEAAVLDDGTFTFRNITPGRYWLIARPVNDQDSAETTARPLAWDSEGRARLRREAERANIALDLQRCQSITDYVLRYR